MFLDEDHTGFISGFGELFEVPNDDEDQIMYRWLELVENDPRAALMYQFENVGVEIFDDVLQVAGGVKEAEVIKEEGEESALPAVPESPDQLVAKVVEIRGKIDSVAKSVANIQAYCANHTDQREINDLTVDLNSGVQDAIEALDDIITAAGYTICIYKEAHHADCKSVSERQQPGDPNPEGDSSQGNRVYYQAIRRLHLFTSQGRPLGSSETGNRYISGRYYV